MIFKYSRRVYLADTDAAGVVYFARGIEICHEAYEESLAMSGISLKQMLQQAIALPIVHAEIDFHRPLYCGDRLKIELRSNLINSSEFIVNYQIYTADIERIAIKAQTRHVCICINPQRKRSDLPSTIFDWINSREDEI